MWNIAEKRKELCDLLERGVSGNLTSAFGLEKILFLIGGMLVSGE